MKWTIWILLINLAHSKNIETDAEAVLTKVLGEIRSKIIDNDNETNSSELLNSTTSLPTKLPTKSKVLFGKKSDDQWDGKPVAVDYTKSISTRQQYDATTISPSTDNSEKRPVKLEKKSSLLSDEIELLSEKTNGDHLVANIVVEPEMPSRGKFEFVPHFDHNTFDFMIPGGQNAKQSLVAVIPFYGVLDQKPPKFTLKDDLESWFSIGQEENYTLYQIPILLNPNVRVSLSSGANGVYSAAIEARQDGTKTEATMKIEVLPMVDDSEEAESPDGDLIVSNLELTTDATNETAGIKNRIEDIFEKNVHEVVVDRFDEINTTESISATTETIITTKIPVNFPEIQIETRGAANKVLLVSENLRRGNKVPEFEIRPSVGILFDKVIEIDVQPDSIFVPRPRFVLPGEASRLVVVDSAALDFESGPKSFDITISAQFMENANKSTQTTKLTIQKYDEADIQPKHILAENNSTLQYTLLGSGSANFRIINGSLILSCQRDFESACLNREITSEYRLLAVAVDARGLSSEAVPVTVSIVDVNDNGPILELFDNDLTIRNGEITAPFLFSVNDADEEKNRNNTVELSNEAAQFLSAEQISNQMYRLHVAQSVTAGSYFLDIAAKDQKGENLSQKARVKVTVMDTAQKAHFQRSRYDRTIGADKLQKGTSLVQLQLDGIVADMIRFVILDGNPGYLTVEKFSGNVYIGELPSNGVPSGYYVVKVGAIDRETGKILATCEIFLSVHGNQLDQTTIFVDPLTTVFMNRDNITDDLILKPTVNINENFTVSNAKAWDDEMVEMTIEENAIKTENGELLIASNFLRKIRSLKIKLVASNNLQDHAFLQYILTTDPKKLEGDVESLAIPQFVAAPWRNETLEIKITEELPIGTAVVCLPAYNPVDGNRIFNLQLSGMGIEFFEVETKTGCIKTKRRIDYETLDPQTFHLTLTAKRGQKSTAAKLQIEVVDVDDNAPELKQLGPETIELAENSKPGVVVAEFIATDRDFVSRRHPIRYKLSGLGADNFRIHKKNETFLSISVAVGAELDHESSEELLLKLTVADGAENLNELPFRITIRDVNDNRPQFVSKSREVDVFDNWATGISIAMFEATDLDSGENARCTYDLDETAKKQFQIDSNSGVVSVAQSLNGMASPDAYRFTVFANDHGDPFLSSTAELVVRIHEAATTSDVDEQELRILSPPIDFVLNLTEGTTAGQLVYRIDAQLGMMMTESVDGLVRYSLEPISAEDEGWLMIDENSGEVYLLRTLDYEVQPFITVGL
ncbi:Fat-like cadherin-related tumor suppressor-like protein [Aphelenchoides besseyi]|nr:Fat-like cadherin-related tumor suppressor-like protein [Aphelenchoides besseyi]